MTENQYEAKLITQFFLRLADQLLGGDLAWYRTYYFVKTYYLEKTPFRRIF